MPGLTEAILLATTHWSSSDPPGAPGILLIGSSTSSRAFAGTSTGSIAASTAASPGLASIGWIGLVSGAGRRALVRLDRIAV